MPRNLLMNLAAAGACLFLALAIGSWEFPGWWFLTGLVWAQFAEYIWHRFVLHGPHSEARSGHAGHHRAFSQNPTVALDDLPAQDGITEDARVFPSAFAAHVAIFVFLTGGFPAFFLAAACIHYAAFEVSHWAIHVQENPIDQVLRHVPGVRRLRAWQILHHFKHHENQHFNFGFTPPFAGDAVFGTRRNER